MGKATVDIRFTSVLKDFKDTDRTRYHKEVTAYTQLDWATPKLIVHNEYWIETERLTPILDLYPDQAKKYKQPLRELLQAVHDAGWWHMDCALVNVVIHPMRGPLLIDWENLTPSQSEVSYDLYGARAAGVHTPWPVPGDDGVWWGGPWDMCPGKWWREC